MGLFGKELDVRNEKKDLDKQLEREFEEAEISNFHREWSLIANRWVRVIYTIFSRLKLPVTSMKALLYLRLFRNNAEPSVIADSISVPRQTMTSILDGMEKKGWVTRQPHPSDRRKKCVQLSKSGGELADRILNRIRSHESRAMLALTSKELSDMLHYMGKFSEAMEREVVESVFASVDQELHLEGGVE